jgi:hypothetical protein
MARRAYFRMLQILQTVVLLSFSLNIVILAVFYIIMQYVECDYEALNAYSMLH